MGEKIGAEVHLDRAPLKYAGLSYTEIWISEAQERMVLAVPEESWPELEKLCRSENVEATVIGRFVPTGRLQLYLCGQAGGRFGDGVFAQGAAAGCAAGGVSKAATGGRGVEDRDQRSRLSKAITRTTC